jgi:hypothetical protein
MILAELEVFQSRPIAPTRRLALGRRELPVSPGPGFGGILLGAVVAGFTERIDDDLHIDLLRLSHQLEQGLRIPQPRLRHRLQVDHVGLNRRVHRLVGEGEEVRFELDDTPGTSPAPQVLAAMYAAGQLDPEPRAAVMPVVRKGLRWRGPVGDGLLEFLTDDGRSWFSSGIADPVEWALGVLGLGGGVASSARPEVQRRFRELLRAAHPDHGAAHEGAAQRIADLTEARRILLAS